MIYETYIVFKHFFICLKIKQKRLPTEEPSSPHEFGEPSPGHSL